MCAREAVGIDDLKVPPQSIEAEQAVLGGLLINEYAWEAIGDQIVEKDFYRHDHGQIFAAIKSLAEKNSPFDLVTVSEWLEIQGCLEDIGGMAYLASLAKETPSAFNIKAYAGIVRERSVMRQLINIATHIANSCYQPEGREAKEILEEAERLIFTIAEQGARSQQGFEFLKDLVIKAGERIDELYRSKGAITGLSTGFKDLDEITSGLQPADLIIVAARPSMGKTAFAMNIAENVALSGDKTVAIFSMEMPGEALALRMLSSLGRIDQKKVRSGQLEDEDWPRLTSSMAMLSNANIYIDDSPGLSPSDLRARCRRLARNNEIGLVVIDYLQLMQVPGKSDNRTAEISEISRSLKMLAKELKAPVIALSQLNRSVEQRPNKRPIMSDLRDSGAIEQDADVIAFIYRDEYYNDDSPDKGIGEVIIGKQRNGPIDTVRLTFLGQYTRFENFASDYFMGG